ncbi:caspase domain-containing protein [Lasiosphaeria hispida]|uniref:Caspase domain-containing protein n=1 Tax=Lasiosphaeria hispida TaxID=260671 RepID=A0AAJ0HJ81_9PEZI|nr:caspase domain-containing protein [Lasiosphaeria hispida]
MERPPLRRFVLLIGINYYIDKPLRGCVSDVHTLRRHLESRPMAMSIEVMTASEPSDPAMRRPQEDAQQWPTRDNVVARLEALTAAAQAGDFVYVHYSGHGTSLGLVPGSRHPHKSTADLSLDLLGPDGASVCYLRGRDLAGLLDKMVSKGLRVTLTLDCCFSGSILRGDNDNEAAELPLAGERFLPYDVKVDAASLPLHLEAALKNKTDVNDDANANASTDTRDEPRDASLLPNWLINPGGYAILAACGPHETAREIEVDGHGHAGALSHFLMRTLSRLGTVDARLIDIYQSVCSRFADRSWLPSVKQTPMLYGNKDLSFLGVLRPGLDATAIPVFRSPAAQLMLRAGRAHGLIDGDRLDLYPLATTAAEPAADARRRRAAVRAHVADSGDLVSTLQGVGGRRIPDAVSIGWSARLVDRPSLQAVPISVAPDLPGLRQLLLAVASEARSPIVLRLGAGPLSPGSFSIGTNAACTGYEIRDDSDAGRPVAGFSAPVPPADRGEQKEGAAAAAAARLLLDALAHLTRFRQVEAIANPRASPSYLDGAFTVRVQSMGDGAWQDVGSRIETTCGSVLEVELRNDGRVPLYFHIYNMGPLWQVRSIFDGDYETIPPRDETRAFSGRETLELDTCVPQQLLATGRTWCDDTIKIFITDEPTSFAVLAMDTLSDALSSKSALADLLQLAIFDGWGEAGDGRALTRGSAGRWATVNIRVRTSCIPNFSSGP